MIQLNFKFEWKVNKYWVPATIFTKGKHASEIALHQEEIDHGIDTDFTKLMIWAEKLGTDVRMIDYRTGVEIRAKFQAGKNTTCHLYINKLSTKL